MRMWAALVGVAAASGIWVQGAQAMIELDIQPRKPTVDKAIKVSFDAKKKLPGSQRYQSTLASKSGSNCASGAVKDTDSNPPAGGRVTIKFMPSDDTYNDANRWCKGNASVSVQITRKSDDGVVRIIGIESFSIKP